MEVLKAADFWKYASGIYTEVFNTFKENHFLQLNIKYKAKKDYYLLKWVTVVDLGTSDINNTSFIYLNWIDGAWYKYITAIIML